ncbi:family transcriptional regulator [Leptolyngbya sp. Heron Island J]|uniref:helix-turn-helix domain-containing protein n=1 Tax=Leptolyngbya sp. Heron Island J TaxID=1385935 RepID=UPI0003B9727B|nr:AraC family transcriptional regulator [Leptolyngbya sp. Heron Island J]ESA38640.1 family transcriptional regulator [Leptolyngbya sp. Heron Island J]
MNQQRYAQFYETSEYSQFYSVKRQDQAGIVDAILSHQSGHCFTEPATADIVLGLTLAGTTAARWRIGPKWREIDTRRIGHIGVSPLNEAYDLDVPDPHTVLVLAINKSRLDVIQQRSRIDCFDIMSVGSQAYISDPECASYAKSIWRALEQPDTLTQIQTEGLVDALLGRLLVRYAGDAAHEPVQAEAINLKTLESFIREQISTPLTVTTLAQVAGRDAHKFSRIFKAQTGVTPYQYVQSVRITMACDMLKTTNSLLSDVAYQLGFADQSHFTRVFRKHMGITPAQYRKGSNAE